MAHTHVPTREEVSEAARELVQKRRSWNPFKSASNAGKIMEAWKEAKRERALKRLGQRRMQRREVA